MTLKWWDKQRERLSSIIQLRLLLLLLLGTAG